jgi:DNA polymerase III delta prime subunit
MMSRYFKVVLCLILVTNGLGPFAANAGRKQLGQSSTSTLRERATVQADSDEDEDEDEDELPLSELDLRLAEVERDFYRKRRGQCARSAVWEGAKLASFVGVNCVGAYLASNLIAPLKVMLSDLTGSPSTADGSREQGSASGAATMKDFAVVSGGVAIAGAFGQELGARWLHRGGMYYQAFISNFRGTRVGDFLGSAKLIEILALVDQLELKYELLQELLPSKEPRYLAQLKGLRRFIDSAKSLADFMLGKVTSVNSPGVFLNPTDGLTPLGRDYAQHYLSIPLSKKRLTEQDKARIQGKLDVYFGETFDPRLKTFFRGQVSRIVDNSLMSPRSTHKDRVNYLFRGPAGTGKTATARALAEALDFGFCKIEGASLRPEHFSKSATASQGGAAGASAVPQIAGALFECMINSTGRDGKPHRNMVVAVDEADHLMRSELHGQGFEKVFKTMLDEHYFYDEAMAMLIDISDVIFVLIANGPLIQPKPGNEKHVQAFNERYETVNFPATTLEQRKIIAQLNFLIPMSRERKYHPTPEDVAFVTDILVPYDLEINEGVRILKHIIDSFIIHRKGEQEIEQFDYHRAFATQGVVAEAAAGRVAVDPATALTEDEIAKLRRIMRAADYLMDPEGAASAAQVRRQATAE